MSIEDIMGFLPTLSDKVEDEIKPEIPYAIMYQWVNAINSKYNEDLNAFVADVNVEDADGIGNLTYSFYIFAEIGRGFTCKLFDVDIKGDRLFPCDIFLFGIEPEHLGTAKNRDELSEKIKGLFQKPVVQKLILSLVNDVQIFRKNNPIAESKF